MRFITTPLALRPQLIRPAFLGLKRPKFRLSFASLFVTIGEAFQLAYVSPYEPRRSRTERPCANRDNWG